MEFVELTLRQGRYQIPLEAVGSLRSPSRHLAPKHVPTIPRGAGLFAVSSFPRLRVGQESCDNSFPRLRVRQESCDNSFLRLRVRQESCDNSFLRLRVGQESCDNSFPRLRVGQESCDNSFLRLRVRQESRDFPSRGSAWGKNRVIFLPAAPREARIVPRNLAAEWFGSGNSVSSFPTSDLGQETVFLASRRVVWSKKRVFFLSRRLGETRNVRKFTRVRRIPLYVRSPVIAKL